MHAAVADVAANDPVGGTSPADPLLHTALWGSLVTLDQDGALRPSLAVSWEQPDSRTLRLTLRPEARFHNGEPVTGQALAAYVEKCQSDYGARGGCRGALGQLGPLQVEEQSVTLTLEEPDATWALRQLWPWGGLNVRPPDYQRRLGYEAFGEAPVGAGPYRLVRRDPQERIELEAFSGWWGPHPFEGPLDAGAVRIVFAPTEETRVALLRAGEVDVAEALSPAAAAALRQQGRAVVDARPNRFLSIIFSTVNERVPGTDVPNPFRDLRLRQALTLALDRDLLRRRFTAGFASAAVGPWNPPVAGAVPREATPLGYDPARARALLAEMGPLPARSWELHAYRASPGAPEAAEAVCQMWQAVGFPCRFNLVETGTLLEWWQDPARAKAYPAHLIRLQTDLAHDPAGFAWYALRSGGYLSQMSDPEVDRLVDEAGGVSGLAERERLWGLLYRRLDQQALLVTLYQDASLVALGPRVVDWPLAPGSPQPWGLWRLRLAR